MTAWHPSSLVRLVGLVLALAFSAAQPIQAQEEPDGSWDVNDPPFPMAEVEVDVTEGTWISLDVSPDGREIVFDLLGDLIVLEGNPLEDLRRSISIRWTMVSGRLFDARSMDEAGNRPRARGPLFWEDWGWR